MQILFLPWDPVTAKNDALNPSGYYSYAAHGYENNSNLAYTTSSSPFDIGMTPQYVGDYLLAHGWDPNQIILAAQCYGTNGGQNSFVAQLAQYLADKTNNLVSIVGSPDEINAEPMMWNNIFGSSGYYGGPYSNGARRLADGYCDSAQ